MKHLSGLVFLKDKVSLADHDFILEALQEMTGAALKGRQGLAFYYAARVLRRLTSARIPWPWRFKLIGKALDLAGLLDKKKDKKPAKSSEPKKRVQDMTLKEREKAIADSRAEFKDMVTSTATRLNKLPGEVLAGCTNEELNVLNLKIEERDLKESQNRVYDQHASPEERLNGIQTALDRLGKKIDRNFKKIRSVDEQTKQRIEDYRERTQQTKKDPNLVHSYFG